MELMLAVDLVAPFSFQHIITQETALIPSKEVMLD